MNELGKIVQVAGFEKQGGNLSAYGDEMAPFEDVENHQFFSLDLFKSEMWSVIFFSSCGTSGGHHDNILVIPELPEAHSSICKEDCAMIGWLV